MKDEPKDQASESIDEDLTIDDESAEQVSGGFAATPKGAERHGVERHGVERRGIERT
jgi:hypothetical protein